MTIPGQIIHGRVTRIGYYGDTLPKLVIAMRKEDALFPCSEGERLPVSFVIAGEEYRAGLRTTARSLSVTVCPDVHDEKGNQVRLTDLLLRRNVAPKTTVVLYWDGAQGLVLS